MHIVVVHLILLLLLLATGCGSEKIPFADSSLGNPDDKLSESKSVSKISHDAKKDDVATVFPIPGSAPMVPPGPADSFGRSTHTKPSFAPAPAPLPPSDAFSGVAERNNVGVVPIESTASLTAGSFDDALNLEIFADYWQDSSLAQSNIKGLEQPNWSELVPAYGNFSYDSLDLAFVIDVTGSMSDELSYLQDEIDSISAQVANLFPDIKQRYSLIIYRDEGDEFVTKKFDFTDELAQFQKDLNRQNSAGGGDYPEAMDQALEKSLHLQWGGNNSAKLLFLVADAPPHDDKIEETFKNVFLLKNMNVNIYPIAASGVFDLAESIMRTSALLTGGQYIFLTDDSGIGNSHAEPKFPCYYVEKLKDVIVRVISDELHNERSEPTTKNIIRKVGNPNHGVCVEQ